MAAEQTPFVQQAGMTSVCTFGPSGLIQTVSLDPPTPDVRCNQPFIEHQDGIPWS
jgi:hypothetical protein